MRDPDRSRALGVRRFLLARVSQWEAPEVLIMHPSPTTSMFALRGLKTPRPVAPVRIVRMAQSPGRPARQSLDEIALSRPHEAELRARRIVDASHVLLLMAAGAILLAASGGCSAPLRSAIPVTAAAQRPSSPEGQKVWAYLTGRYGRSIRLPGWSASLSGTFSEEYIRDRYFDTPDLTLLESRSGVRHRMRATVGDPDGKVGRELVQVKIARPRRATRAEVTFVAQRRWTRAAPPGIAALIKDKHHASFARVVSELGIDPAELEWILSVDQRRRRVSLADDAGAFATLTLDEATAGRGDVEDSFMEIDLELDEGRYSAADPAERIAMEQALDAIEADLQARFPGVDRDQTPKYNKAVARLAPRIAQLRRGMFQRRSLTSR